MKRGSMPIGRRERAKRDKRERILAAAAVHAARRQGRHHPADRRPSGRCDRDLCLYESTKAELLIMAQNAKFTDLRPKATAARLAFAHPPCRALWALP